VRRVCLFIPQLAIGGSERQLLLLAGGLRDEGFEPVVATLDLLDGFANRFVEAGLDPVVLPRRTPLGLDSVAALSSLLRHRRVDLLHAWLFAANWRAALARVLTPRVPVVISVRSMENDIGRAHELAYRLVSPLVHAVITNVATLAEAHRRRTGTSDAKYRVIPNGVETRELDADAGAPAEGLEDLPSTGPIIGYVGRLATRKRVETLARIAPAVLAVHDDARFVVVGDGPSRASIVAACRSAGVLDRFSFLGARDRVGRYLRRMTVFVNPGYGEGASNAILEAMALGVPVVAYAEAGNVDTIQDRVTGWLVPEGDEAALTRRVVDLLSDRASATRMGAAASAFVREELSVRRMVRRTAELYREILTGGTKAAPLPVPDRTRRL
jgi:glycosyltransferase involved in cell wall biosynthesis